jgi:ATP-dependent Lon protease
MQLDDIDKKLLRIFPGMVVRKDLAAKLKGAYSVPTYVLEFLLGKYCSNPDEAVISAGVAKVKDTLENHYLNPEKIEVVKSKIREEGSFKILDRLKIRLVPSEDKYWGQLSGLNLNYIHVPEDMARKNERMLLDGVWGINEIGYDASLSRKGNLEPFVLRSFQPVQLSTNLATKIIGSRKEFTKEEWIHILLRSIGLEPGKFSDRQQMLLVTRLVPFVERNINFVEFGPRSTGKSFSFRELSPHSILISGGQTSIANLFVSNVGTGKPGLVSYYDVVAFDEVAGLQDFSDTAELQIFKDYMESGSFSRGKGDFTGKASLVFVGNLDADVQTAVKTAHLFIPFPFEMQDLAFLDRFHVYLPGWELPRFKADMFTSHFGFIVDIMAEYFQIMRDRSFYSNIDSAISWGKDLDQRDQVRVRAVTSGLLKLIYPDGQFTTAELQECLRCALEFRRRVKEQLRKMGAVEFRKTNFSYILNETMEEAFVETPEQALASLYSPLDAKPDPGIGFTLGLNSFGRYSLYRIEVGLRKGKGTWNATGLAGKPIKEALITVRDYVKANLKHIRPEIEEHDIKSFDTHVQVVDLMQSHQGSQTGLGFFITIVSAFTKIPLKPRTIVVGEMTISGALIPIQSLAEIILIGRESGAVMILLPDISEPLLAQVPSDILEGIEIQFFHDPIEAWDLSKSVDERAGTTEVNEDPIPDQEE